MGFAKVKSAQTIFLDAKLVDIEIDTSLGLHSFVIVGLPDKAVSEAKDRISSAIKNSGFKSPKQKNQKVVVSLAPADLRKAGPHFDLGIAIGYLAACKELVLKNQPDTLFLGELSLDGKLRRINGTIPLVNKAKNMGIQRIFLPKENAVEAALISNVSIYGAESLLEVIHHISESAPIHLQAGTLLSNKTNREADATRSTEELCIQHIHGQDIAKRALEIAAAGKHNILLSGPPGVGKTMLAKALPSILPQLTLQEIIEVSSIYSISGMKKTIITTPPFRAPHHTSSHSAIIGSGTHYNPGEITLAHRGVLFLDELPEFNRRVIESLRQPLEDKRIHISTTKGSWSLPADFILIAAMNLCPCGNFGGKERCTCPPIQLINYQKKISGPILDRIDLHIPVEPTNWQNKEKCSDPETSAVILERVVRVRNIQAKRCNPKTAMPTVSHAGRQLLTATSAKHNLSMRAYHGVLAVARTIADLEGEPAIGEPHILEALQYRLKKTGTIRP